MFIKDGAGVVDQGLAASPTTISSRSSTCRWLAGTTLDAPQTAVITQSEAIKRFGTDQVVGRTLTIISRGVTRDFKITGVLKDLPKNSSLKINAHPAAGFQQLLSPRAATS